MRLLLDMLPDKDTVLQKFVDALKPGGWLVLEEFDLEHQLPDPGAGSSAIALFKKVHLAFQRNLEARGADSASGRELPRLFRQHRLENINAEGRAFIRQGGEPGRVAWRLSLERVAPLLIEEGSLTQEEISQHYLQLDDPNFFYLSPLMVATRGQKPTTETTLSQSQTQGRRLWPWQRS